MVEKQFSDARLAALYDLYCPWDARADLAFYLPLVMSARSVLDVGCGTGALLHAARAAGHTGRLCGLDPAAGMLKVARARRDVEWVLGDLATAPAWHGEFELAVMTGHAFQQLLGDDELRVALATLAAALTDDGSFVFETRNPLVREWQDWHERYSGEVVDATGAVVHCACRVETPVRGDVEAPERAGLVSFTQTYTSPGWHGPRQSRSTLRFLGPDTLAEFLADAGMVAAEQFGNWDGSPLTDASPEIITVARHR